MISYVRKYLSKFRQYYKNYGLIWLIRHIVTNLVQYSKTLVIESEIKKQNEKIVAKIPVTIRLISETEKDIDDVAELHLEDNNIITFDEYKSMINERLRAGDGCMVAEYDGKIIHMNWMGFHDTHLFEPFERKRGLVPGEVLSHNTVCAKRYRSNGLMKAVRSEVFNYLADGGYSKLVNNIDHNNQASRKVTKRFGGKCTGVIYGFKILGVNIDIFRRYKTDKLW